MSYRSVRLIDDLPERWHVRLEGIKLSEVTDGDASCQTLGRISLETRRFDLCEEESWQPNALAVRVNLVIDPAVDHFSLTLLEVPDRFKSVAVKTPSGWESFEPAHPYGTFELWKALSAYCLPEEGTYPLTSVLDYFEAGLLEFAFATCTSEMKAENLDDGLDAFLLDSLGAVEADYDYDLPCGLHAATHINAGKLCHSEGALHAVASALNTLFRDVTFDTVVVHGWAMATVARRLATLRSEQAGLGPIGEILFEGYSPPLPVEDLRPGSQVLLLVDVVVSGRLLQDLQQAVRAVVPPWLPVVVSSMPAIALADARTRCGPSAGCAWALRGRETARAAASSRPAPLTRLRAA